MHDITVTMLAAEPPLRSNNGVNTAVKNLRDHRVVGVLVLLRLG